MRDGKLEELIGLLVREGGSDLHLKVGSPPVTRIQGLLTPVEGYGVLNLPDTEAFLEEIIPEPLVEEFERVVAETAAAHGGRVVKLIGDGAMFTAPDASAGCALALEVAERAAESDNLPPVRVGLAAGAAVSRNGRLRSSTPAWMTCSSVPSRVAGQRNANRDARPARERRTVPADLRRRPHPRRLSSL